MQPAASTAIREPEIRLTSAADGGTAVALSGAWDIRALQARATELGRALARHARATSWDLTEIQRIDHIGALLIWRAWEKRRPAALALRPEHEALFARLGAPRETSAARARADWLEPLRSLGDLAAALAGGALEIVRLLGQVMLDALAVLRDPLRGPWREISAGVYRTGAQALGITALVGFLIGVVLSYLSAEQLRDFGANAFVVNIVGIGVVRELGPMLAAILVAGRSGSAITAQLGVMRVTEELDALAVMGIPQSLRLVFPKVVALAVAVPLLVLWTDAIALAGGMLSAKWQLGIGYRTFVQSLPAAVPIANYWIGLGKGAAFGALIALIACHFGLRIEPNTESLGAGTTRSVVAAITVVIIVDALVAVMFSGVGMGLR